MHLTDLLPLCRLPAGMIGRVRSLTATGDVGVRVRELGFGEATLVRKVAGSGPFICQVNECRLILSHDIAATILVEPLPRWAAGTSKSA